jgi:predicted acylesterase/phospholipase RssA
MAKALSTKGMFSMDLFEKTLIDMFLEIGFDVRDKKISDAKMPLYIVSSNISKGTPTLFSKDVSLLEAIKCSCCMPGIFKPQELYGQLYVDGDLFCPSMSSILPNHHNTLILSLPKVLNQKITPYTVDKISPIDYIHDLHVMTQLQLYKSQKKGDVVSLKYPQLKSTSNLNEFDVNHILEVARQTLRTFLSKCANKECSESVSSRLA